jgi:two-component system, NarL family, invasion response regulator UvrY
VIRVLLADDHAMVRQGISRLVDSQPDMCVAAEVCDGDAAVEAVFRGGIDVVVLDLSLPKIGGIEVLRQIEDAPNGVAVVVLTMYPKDQLALHLLRGGASAYLNKTRSPLELLEAIRRVAAGYTYLTDALDALARETPASGPPHQNLTAREYQVFIQLVAGMTVSDIAGALEIAVSTVSNHVASVRTKLGAALSERSSATRTGSD